MVRRRVTSSVKRCAAVATLLCSIFLPARFCRKAKKLDVVKGRVASLTAREDVGSNPGWFRFSSDFLENRRASSSADSAPNVPRPFVPAQRFCKEM